MSARLWALALGVYLLAAVVVTYPLVRDLGGVLPGHAGDNGFFLWSIDTFWTEIDAGASPFYTDRVLYPVGTHLLGSNCVPLLAILGWPFRDHLILFGGLVALASLVLAAVGMARLVQLLIPSRPAAILGGLFYGCAPALLAQLNTSHFTSTTAAALLPFGLRFLLIFMRTAAWTPLVGVSAVVWALQLTEVYTTAAFLIMAAVVTAVLIPRNLTAVHARRMLAALLVNGALAGALVFWTMPLDVIADLPRGGPPFWSRANADLADALVPSPTNPILGALHGRWASDPNNGDVETYFLGWGLLLLAAVALAGREHRREKIALAAAGLVVLVLACGTNVRFADVPLLADAWTPYHWLAKLPYFKILDSTRRLVVGASVVATALAAVGAAQLADRSRRPRLVYLGVLALFLVEFGRLGMTVSGIPVPAIYRQLAALPDATVLEVGSGLASSNMFLGIDGGTPSAHHLYWQTIHRKRRTAGYLSRIPYRTLGWFREAPIMGDLLLLAHNGKAEWANKPYTPAEVEQFLRTFDLGYVIIPPGARQATYAAVLDKLLADHIERKERAELYLLYVLRRPQEDGTAPPA